MVIWERLNHLAYAATYKNYLILAYRDSFRIKRVNTPQSIVSVGEELGFEHWKKLAENWLFENAST